MTNNMKKSRLQELAGLTENKLELEGIAQDIIAALIEVDIIDSSVSPQDQEAIDAIVNELTAHEIGQ